jgi:transcriptional regulator with XRE-family HTH domain
MWGEAVRELLDHAKIKHVRLLDAIAVTPGALSRYLNGKRSPGPATLKKANREIGRLLRSKGAEYYLNAVAAYHNSLDYDDDESKFAALLGSAQGLRMFDEYMPEEKRTAMFDAILAMPIEQMVRLLVAIYGAWGRRFLRHLDGSVPTTTEFDETITICEKHGLDVKPYLRPEEQLRVLRARDAFTLSVRKALAEATPDFALRHRLERQVLAAFQKYVDIDAEETLRIPFNDLTEE